MKARVKIKVKREVLACISGISYKQAATWYGVTKRDLKMDLIVPKERAGDDCRPAIIWLCGGGFSVMNRSVWLPELMFFAEAGYVVASIDYRTSNEAMFPAQLQDIKAAIRYLKAHAVEYGIDPDRIAIMGESAGASLSALVGVMSRRQDDTFAAYDVGENLRENSDVKCVVTFYGIFDMLHNLGESNEDCPSWTGIAYVGNEENAKSASAIYFVHPDTPSFLLLHGESDTLVPIEQSEAMYEKLVSNGVTADLYTLPEAVHGDAAFYQTDMKEKVLDYLKKHL